VKKRAKWNLRQLMADRRVKNKDLAEALGIHWTAISRMKSKDEMPRIDGASLMTICDVLNCRLTELVEEEGVRGN
jgi:putative transcriptional regulator